jgi:hypothetical protein
MNLPLALLWLILLFLVIFLVVLFFLSVYSYLNNPSVISPSGVTTCNVPFDQLQSVAAYNCCTIGSVTTASRYIPELDMVVNPVEIDYQTVCSQFCTEGIDLVNGICHNRTGQQKYEKCITLSKPPNTCSKYSLPVAVLGTTYYYPYSAGDQSCKNTAPCYF